MKKTNQEVENLIVESLNTDKPDRRVLEQAKRMMTQECEQVTSSTVFQKEVVQKQVPSAKKYPALQKRVWAILAPCFVALIAVICCIPLMLNHNPAIMPDEPLTPQEITSIQEYNRDNDLSVHFLEEQIISSVLYSDTEGNAIYICESYSVGNIQISLYVLLSDYTEPIAALDKFSSLSMTTTISDTIVVYDLIANEYCASLVIGDYRYMLSATTQTAHELLEYAQELLL